MNKQPQRECTEVKIKVPWGNIAGKWWGPQNTRPILAVHGWQDNAGTFDTLIPLLPPHIGILAIDLPGHGHSSHFPDGIMYHSVDFVNLILMIMSEYNWEKVSLLGHSMGSITSFKLAGIFPDKVDMLIGIDTYKPLTYMEVNLPLTSHHIIQTFLNTDKQKRNEEEPPSYPYDECTERLYEGVAGSIDRDKCSHILNRNIRKSSKYPDKYYFARDNRLKAIDIGVWKSDSYGELLERIKCPTMFIRALDSPIHGDIADFHAHMDILRKGPKFEYYDVEGRHHVHLNNPERVSGMISKFLLKYRPAPAKL